MSKFDQWVGFDLDGTLAEYDGWRGIEHIGEPISATLALLTAMLHNGVTVKIMTARACDPASVPYIEDWCREHIGVELEVTNAKDYGMVALFDDRAVAVEKNTGNTLCYDGLANQLREATDA